jgi:SAM-dependent methyltransferase
MAEGDGGQPALKTRDERPVTPSAITFKTRAWRTQETGEQSRADPSLMNEAYVHGYRARESERLLDQAGTLAEILHSDAEFPPGSRVLEVGCGVGAQTILLARRSPQARFTSIDISAISLAEAERRAAAAGLRNVEFRQADLFALPFEAGSFDYIFICFVLEHLAQPVEALAILHGLLKPGGAVLAIEGDHGATVFHPETEAARAAIECLVKLQRSAGGDGLIGRRLYPLLVAAGFHSVRVAPRMMYVDASRPQLFEGFTRKTFIAMIEGVREPALAAGLISPATFDAGIASLHRTTGADGTFCYTFFRAWGQKLPLP